jgi:hypothetical protein
MQNGRCYKHGGATPKGVDSPHFKGKGRGKYAQILPDDLRKVYDIVAEDGEWASLRANLDLLTSRVMGLLGSLPEGEPPLKLWRDALASLSGYQLAVATRDGARQIEQMSKLLVTLERGLAIAGVWDEVYDVLELHRKLVESERKRMVEMQQIITPEQGAVIFAAMVEMAKLVAPENKPAAAALLRRVMPPVPVQPPALALPAEVD